VSTINDRPPNFRSDDAQLFLVRCFACADGMPGRENWGPAVATGCCAWCGWSEEYPNPRREPVPLARGPAVAGGEG
jgi:hypothetical protein